MPSSIIGRRKLNQMDKSSVDFSSVYKEHLFKVDVRVTSYKTPEKLLPLLINMFPQK